MQLRAEAKDYVVIDALLTDGRVDLLMALSSARALYGQEFNPQITLKALTYFEDGSLQTLTQDVKDRLVRASASLDLDQFPAGLPR